MTDGARKVETKKQRLPRADDFEESLIHKRARLLARRRFKLSARWGPDDWMGECVSLACKFYGRRVDVYSRASMERKIKNAVGRCRADERKDVTRTFTNILPSDKSTLLQGMTRGLLDMSHYDPYDPKFYISKDHPWVTCRDSSGKTLFETLVALEYNTLLAPTLGKEIHTGTKITYDDLPTRTSALHEAVVLVTVTSFLLGHRSNDFGKAKADAIKSYCGALKWYEDGSAWNAVRAAPVADSDTTEEDIDQSGSEYDPTGSSTGHNVLLYPLSSPSPPPKPRRRLATTRRAPAKKSASRPQSAAKVPASSSSSTARSPLLRAVSPPAAPASALPSSPHVPPTVPDGMLLVVPAGASAVAPTPSVLASVGLHLGEEHEDDAALDDAYVELTTLPANEPASAVVGEKRAREATEDEEEAARPTKVAPADRSLRTIELLLMELGEETDRCRFETLMRAASYLFQASCKGGGEETMPLSRLLERAITAGLTRFGVEATFVSIVLETMDTLLEDVWFDASTGHELLVALTTATLPRDQVAYKRALRIVLCESAVVAYCDQGDKSRATLARIFGDYLPKFFKAAPLMCRAALAEQLLKRLNKPWYRERLQGRYLCQLCVAALTVKPTQLKGILPSISAVLEFALATPMTIGTRHENATLVLALSDAVRGVMLAHPTDRKVVTTGLSILATTERFMASPSGVDADIESATVKDQRQVHVLDGLHALDGASEVPQPMVM